MNPRSRAVETVELLAKELDHNPVDWDVVRILAATLPVEQDERLSMAREGLTEAAAERDLVKTAKAAIECCKLLGQL